MSGKFNDKIEVDFNHLTERAMLFVFIIMRMLDRFWKSKEKSE